MIYLTIEEVYFLHELSLQKAGGRPGVRDFTLIHSAVSRPAATFAGIDLYKDIYQKGAALIHSLILNHPFEDANKRTGFFSLNAFFHKNGYELKFTENEGIKLCLKIENKSYSFKNIASWLKKNTRKI
ncbi:hypothetical protein A2773_02190 [Candidatus Gottesmanbacteria bacterium RIFCSPHIGHO2_01_FULL_39_10]|uniref:Fido domain-containing protein n=1 Tax=Candidatus Gottesmanbacteria bacterium RIFCSPHIGHO2_01_FULL_39_10 TaxID=1798375 RepID=A0A1F5ZQH7_9BACT|nr:MAG: hypothetical protein A2773_02190 [Candidatus Gottesmanbacteria bacterium RIFCSPHIGHO2_01_FULL_39_10]